MARGWDARDRREERGVERPDPIVAGGVPKTLAVLALFGVAFAQDPAAGLRYSATPRQREIPLGGKLILECRLSNEGDAPVTVFWGDRAYDDQYRFVVVHEDGTVLRRPHGRPMPPFDVLPARGFRDLPPGGVLSYRVWLSPGPGRNGQTCYFRRPGRYSADPSLLVLAARPDGQSDGGKPVFRELWRKALDAEPVLFRVTEKSADRREEQSGPVSIEARVVDPDGRPVPDADVTVRVRQYNRLAGTGLDSAGGGSNWRSVKIDRRRTDESGIARFERLPDGSPWFELEAGHPRYAAAEVRILNQPPERDYSARIVLTPAKTVGGIVVDSDGAPVPGVLVRPLTAYPRRETYTGADGRFVLESVVPRNDGTVRCQVVREGYVCPDASSPVAVATSRAWRIEIVANDRLSVSGRAVFADGTPATGLGLRFASPATGGAGTQDAVTDGDGRFSVIIARPLPEPVTAWLGPVSRKNAHTPPGHWRTQAKDLRPGRRDMELVFENRGAIEVRVEPGNELAPNMAFGVSCSVVARQFGRERTWSLGEETVGPQGGQVTFPGLSVGTYELTVLDRVRERCRWTQRTTLPAPDGRVQVVVPFRLPQLHFGSVRARILRPGGTTPLEAGAVWVGASGFGEKIPIEHGDLTVDQVPAGPVVLSCDIRGYEFEIRRKSLRAGGTTDFGDIELKPKRAEEERSGTVEGRVLFDDGTPALGTIVSVPRLGRSVNRGPVGLDGAFRLGCPEDGGLLIIDLADTPVWPRAQIAKDLSPLRSGGWSCAWAWADRLLLPVKVSPGQTARRDVILPRSCTGSVEVKWLGAPDPDSRSSYCALLVQTQAGLLSCGPPRAYNPERGRLAMPIARLPDGRRTVLLRTPDYGGYRDADDTQGHTTVTFDPSVSGTIRGKVNRPDGQPAAEVRVRLYHPGLPALGQFRLLTGLAGTPPPMDLGECETAADGSFRFPRVGPGRYVARAGRTRNAPTREVTVTRGEEATVELTIDEWVSPRTPPLRQE